MTIHLRPLPLLLLVIVAWGGTVNLPAKTIRPQLRVTVTVVTGVVDDDSLYLNIDGRATLVRLAQIDA